MNRIAIALFVAASIAGASCAGVKRPIVQNTPPPPGASMWVEPTDLATRDLYNGPWGADNAPNLWDTFTLVEKKHTGVNLGMTVKDERRPRMERQAGLSRRARSGRTDRGRAVAAVVRRRLSPAADLLPAGVPVERRLGHAHRSGRAIPAQGIHAEGHGPLEVGRQPIRRQQAVSGPDRAADDVQQHRPEEQQQHPLRASRWRPRRALVRGPRHRLGPG